MAIAGKRVLGSRAAFLPLTAAVIFAFAVSAHGQYRYQPSAEYYHNDTASGTVMGGAFGAITGAIIGGSGDRGEGALIGAGVGALTGNLLGRQKDRVDEQRAAAGMAAVAQANQQATAQAVTNYDLVRMAQAGVGDELIISTIRSRGARLDLSPGALIALKESGVSDPVLIAAQQMSGRPLPAPATIVTEAVPSTVILAPPPRRVYRYAPRYPYRRSRVHYHFRF